jgi:hypothetical protein
VTPVSKREARKAHQHSYTLGRAINLQVHLRFFKEFVLRGLFSYQKPEKFLVNTDRNFNVITVFNCQFQ